MSRYARPPRRRHRSSTVLRGGTVSVGRIVSLGVLDCIWQRGRVEIVSATEVAVVGCRRWNFPQPGARRLGSAIPWTEMCPGSYMQNGTDHSSPRAPHLGSPMSRYAPTRRAGGIDRRRVLRGGTVSVGRIVSLGVLDCGDRWNVLSRLHGGLARRFTGLMAQAIVARVCIPQLRLIVHMPGGSPRTSGASLSAIVVAAASTVGPAAAP